MHIGGLLVLRTALITGVTGQDGYLLSHYLLDKGYKVVGTGRRLTDQGWRFLESPIQNQNFTYIPLDVTDPKQCRKILTDTLPDEVYNLAAQSYVPLSWTSPSKTIETNSIGLVNILEAVLLLNKEVRVYQASSSEMFGNSDTEFQSETTPMIPVSVYGSSKLMAHNIVRNYRSKYGLFVVSGILFNHESEYRSEHFVTRKITKAVAEIYLGKRHTVDLGNLDVKRDWGYAKDYVEAMYLMLQNDVPKDYCIGTGITHSVKEFIEEAFKVVGVKDYKNYVKVNPKYIRKSELFYLKADYTKAKEDLKWEPRTSFEEMVKLMVQKDLERTICK